MCLRQFSPNYQKVSSYPTHLTSPTYPTGRGYLTPHTLGYI